MKEENILSTYHSIWWVTEELKAPAPLCPLFFLSQCSPPWGGYCQEIQTFKGLVVHFTHPFFGRCSVNSIRCSRKVSLQSSWLIGIMLGLTIDFYYPPSWDSDIYIFWSSLELEGIAKNEIVKKCYLCPKHCFFYTLTLCTTYLCAYMCKICTVVWLCSLHVDVMRFICVLLLTEYHFLLLYLLQQIWGIDCLYVLSYVHNS